MIHLTRPRVRRLIRGWAQTGRRFTIPFPWSWESVDGVDLRIDGGTYASRNSDTGIVMIWPRSETRLGHWRTGVVASILRRSGVDIFIGNRVQMSNARFLVEKVVATQWAKGFPLALLHGTASPRWRQDRPAYFLSGYDTNEGRIGYFLCELPPGREYSTVAEALEALKPEAVKLAQKAGREVKRQGDLFFVPMADFDPTETDTYKKFGAPILEGFIGDTNHAAHDLCQTGEAIYVRGLIRHVPEDRGRDHKNVRLGRTWHLVARNTVPVETR